MIMRSGKPEILAPAGDFVCLQAAIDAGADAVYFGLGTFNMRARSGVNFAEADLPVGVVGRGAFRGCTSLREVRFSPLLRILGADAFAGCTSLRRADVPDSCTRIGPGAFDGCPLAPGAEPEPHAESAEDEE